jgi:hypothetical protein
MHASDGPATDREAFLDNVTAELTEAAYLVALRHSGEGSWIDLKLDLWNVLATAVHKLRRQVPRRSPG